MHSDAVTRRPTSMPPPPPVMYEPRCRSRSFQMPGWLVSLLVHELALLLLVIVSTKIAMGPNVGHQVVLSWEDGEAEDPSTGDAGLLADSFSALAESAAEQDEQVSALTPKQLAATFEVEPSMEMAELPTGGSGKGAGDLLASLSAGGGGTAGNGKTKTGLGGYGGTRLFGLEAQGRKFVYVFDRSQSMAEYGGVPLEAAKRELIASINQLTSQQQFYIITYNHKPRLFNLSYGRLAFATESNLDQAGQYIQNVEASGGTEHYEPLRMAMNLKPDVIFLITDGEAKDDLSVGDLRRLEQINSGGATIHVILFAASPRPNSTLMRLAKNSRGNYKVVDITRLSISE